ncbi:UDP-galactopyranose mutase [Candidatus Roizmanbacteria bacterium]|nr:UDP-galactopyranose mutase [Candidatus Roizmanbacteria bacterium]
MLYDVVIVGAGISGATIAERCATILGKRVLVIEKRNHIGGNCFDYLDENGILISKYGAHIFHTNHDDVWNYINKFSKWKNYYHKVLCHVDNKLVPLPVNITTVNLLFGLHIQNESEMKEWLNTQIEPIVTPHNSEESALSRVGRSLYEILFKSYTQKQWDTDPRDLDASVLERIPVRTNFDDRYFSDRYQAMPSEGYTKVFEKMLTHPNITLKLNTDYLDVRNEINPKAQLFFSGPIDLFFGRKFGKNLAYRSLRFEFETYNIPYYQTNSVVNYPSGEPYTRIVEYKQLNSQIHSKTTISKEYPTWEGEPYYPVLSRENLDLYLKYKNEATKIEDRNVHFVGRLANYKYFNMDQAFKNALDLFYSLFPNSPKDM